MRVWVQLGILWAIFGCFLDVANCAIFEDQKHLKKKKQRIQTLKVLQKNMLTISLYTFFNGSLFCFFLLQRVLRGWQVWFFCGLRWIALLSSTLLSYNKTLYRTLYSISIQVIVKVDKNSRILTVSRQEEDGFSLTFPRSWRKSKNRLNTSLS